MSRLMPGIQPRRGREGEGGRSEMNGGWGGGGHEGGERRVRFFDFFF